MPDKKSEAQIQHEILVFLNKLPNCFAWRNNNGATYDPTSKTFRSLGAFSHRGVPDILGLHVGKLLAIEVKSETGKVSKEQQVFIDKLNRMGAISFVARSVDEVREALRNHQRESNGSS